MVYSTETNPGAIKKEWLSKGNSLQQAVERASPYMRVGHSEMLSCMAGLPLPSNIVFHRSEDGNAIYVPLILFGNMNGQLVLKECQRDTPPERLLQVRLRILTVLCRDETVD